MISAVLLGGVAVFLVVVGHTQKQVQIGLLVGLWGVLLGAFTLFGPRRGTEELDDEALAAGPERAPARREHELQREVVLRRDMERILRDELSQLRGEVAGLRNDLVEKVNGQLRLERIETTRVISSDIEELQHEVRRLAVSGSTGTPAALDGATAFPPATVVESRIRNSAPLPYVYANTSGRTGAAPSAARPTPRSEPAPPPPLVTPGQPTAAPRPVPKADVTPERSRPAPAPSPIAAPAASAPGRALPPGPALNVPVSQSPEHTTSVLPRPQTPPAAPAPAPTPAPARPPAPAMPLAPAAAPVLAAPTTPAAPLASSIAASHPAADIRAPEPSDPLDELPRLSRFEYDWDEPNERRPPALVWDFDHVEPPPRPPVPERSIEALPPQPEPRRPAAPAPYIGRRRSAGESTPRYEAGGGVAQNWPVPNGAVGNGAGANETGGNGTAPYGAPSYGAAPYGAPPNGAAAGAANGTLPYGAPPNGAAAGAANGAVPYGAPPNGAAAAAANGAAPNGTQPNGANGVHVNGSAGAPNGSHVANGEARPAVGGRRRRADGEVDDVLARLLGR